MDSWGVQFVCIAAVAVVSPACAAGAGAALAVRGGLRWDAVTAGVSAGWVLRAVVVYLVSRCFGDGACAWPMVGRRWPRVSRADWGRRVSGRAWETGFSGQFVRRLRGSLWWWLGAHARDRGGKKTLTSALTRGEREEEPRHLAPRRFTPESQDREPSLGVVVMARACGIVAWSAAAMAGAAAGAWAVLRWAPVSWGGWGVACGAALAAWAANWVPKILVRGGRNELRASVTRVVRHEFWPAWVFYLPLYPHVARLAFKHGGVMTPSCCNPGIEAGGGVIGESKSRIMASLARGAPGSVRSAVLSTGAIGPGEVGERVSRALAWMNNGAGAIGWPIIAKPDQGQRGFAVKLIRHDAALREYFAEVSRACVVQPYHPGPMECGVLWVREVWGSGGKNPDLRGLRSGVLESQGKGDAGTGEPHAENGGTRGRIFSITRKTFPIVEGDGVRTLEELIESHPRYRCQAGVFLSRFMDEASRVPGAGERVRLAVSGNHCQGTMFEDGADLITPELEAAIDALAANFAGGLDFGRFDLRYTSDDELRAGRGFGVVELNGTFSESTNLYDPKRSVVWAYRVLFAQWEELYRLGAWRRGTGVRPMRKRELLAAVRSHFGGRDGSAISD